MNKCCADCYFGDQCCCEEVCTDYYPVETQAEEEAIEEFIEDARAEFHTSWFEYIEECGD